MRILMLNYEYPPLGGGGGKQSMYLAKELAKKHSVYFLTAGWKEFGITKKDGYVLHRLKTTRKQTLRCSNTEMLSYVQSARKVIDDVVKKFKPDVVHVFFTIPTGLLVFHPSLKKIPFIVSVRGSDVPGHNPDRFKILYDMFKPVVRKIWKKASAVVCNSDDLRKEVQKLSPGLKVSVIPNGIDTNKFKPIIKRKESKTLTLLYVGRLIPLKRIDLIIRALAELKTKKKINLRIVGTGEQETELKKLAKELGVEKNIEFAGEVSYDKIEKEYQQADIYIQMSRIEGMSNTILEAMSCGLPIITTNVGGVSAYMKDNGFILRKNIEEELKEALKKYFVNPNLIKKHGQKSREITEKMGWKSVGNKYGGLCNELA